MSGAPCFVVSVLYIGGITYIVGEFAALFGCAVGLPDAVTAYSFVALGTSLPDTFASRQAATESPDADAAIGNVTGARFRILEVVILSRTTGNCLVCF